MEYSGLCYCGCVDYFAVPAENQSDDLEDNKDGEAAASFESDLEEQQFENEYIGAGYIGAGGD